MICDLISFFFFDYLNFLGGFSSPPTNKTPRKKWRKTFKVKYGRPLWGFPLATGRAITESTCVWFFFSLPKIKRKNKKIFIKKKKTRSRMRRYRRCFSHFFFSGSVKSSLRHQGESYTHGYLLLIIISVGVPRCVAVVSIPVQWYRSRSISLHQQTHIRVPDQTVPPSQIINWMMIVWASLSFFPPPPPFFQLDSQQNVILIAPKRDLSLFLLCYLFIIFLFSILRLLLLRCEEFRDDGTRIGIPPLPTTTKNWGNDRTWN
jgi:hypothetical protein